jgi:hypothetical protein
LAVDVGVHLREPAQFFGKLAGAIVGRPAFRFGLIILRWGLITARHAGDVREHRGGFLSALLDPSVEVTLILIRVDEPVAICVPLLAFRQQFLGHFVGAELPVTVAVIATESALGEGTQIKSARSTEAAWGSARSAEPARRSTRPAKAAGTAGRYSRHTGSRRGAAFGSA